MVDLMPSEAIKINAIKGEDLNRDSEKSYLLSLTRSDVPSDNPDQKAVGAVSLLVDVRNNWQTSLTHDLLRNWQTMAVSEQRYTSVLRGVYSTILRQCRSLARTSHKRILKS